MDEPILIWDSQGLPHSTLFDDKYFCKENGYEETLYVSCQGNRLQERFSQLDPLQPGVFTIVETGFGTGLNFCCAWQVWKQSAPASWVLHFVSLEKYPLTTSQLAQALSLWPALTTQREQLSKDYHPQASGVGRMSFDNDHVRLTIVYADVIEALGLMHEELNCCADAIFLDGFAPSKNPQMWSVDVFAGLAKLSKPGTTLATFTVAGWVRRGLESQGFRLLKAKGYGTKKHILVGTWHEA